MMFALQLSDCKLAVCFLLYVCVAIQVAIAIFGNISF